jgi:transposase-like protein
MGVSHVHQSDTLKGLSVLLYVLGLSYQGVADLLEALQYPLSKATVYANVQAAGQHAIQLRKQWCKQQHRPIQVLGMDFTHVKCKGTDQIVAVATAMLTGEPLDIEIVQAESTLHAERWIRGIARTVGAEILVTDDADGLKTVADDLGLKHQICRAHVNRNVHELLGTLGEKALDHPDPIPPELSNPDLTVDQFLDDVQTVEHIITTLPTDGQAQLLRLATRYQYVRPPTLGHRATMWYRMRLLTLDWSENWARLEFYRRWRGPNGEQLDGTNNVTEQVIGQWIKERYRTMRGYKRKESILNVSSVTAWLGMKGHVDELSRVVAN